MENKNPTYVAYVSICVIYVNDNDMVFNFD